VHVPKAGGSSLLRALERAYGAAFRTDYRDNPADPLSQRVLDPASYLARGERFPAGVDCVHGHFHPGKYAIDDGVVLATILREPVDNLISIYSFWKNLPRGHDALHDYFLDRQLGVLECARLPLLRRLLSETYFGGFDMGRFDLIGRHDDRAAALRRLGGLVGASLDVDLHENATPKDERRLEMSEDRALRHRLEQLLADDIRFYQRYAP
jgi:hypothetical protein